MSKMCTKKKVVSKIKNNHPGAGIASAIGIKFEEFTVPPFCNLTDGARWLRYVFNALKIQF
jgi:hypothetical protein